MRFNSFDEMLKYYANSTPDAPAIIYEDTEKEVCSFKQLDFCVDRRAQELKDSGKTCIGIFSDGSFNCVVNIFAANKAGLQIVMLDANVPLSTTKMLVSLTDIDLIYGSKEFKTALFPTLTKGVTDGKDKILFFTSGTTNLAKAVTLTGNSLCQSAYNGGAKLPINADDTLICMLPLGHVFGFVCGLLWALSSGASVALGRGQRHFIDDMAYFKPTVLSAVPTLLDFLNKQDLLNPELRLILVGAGDCAPVILENAKKKGIKVSFGYGLTETSSGVAISVDDDPYAMDICPDNKITIAEDGEILVYAPTCIMKGYYKQPKETNVVLKDGILHTGDIGKFDDNGKLHIIGRKKEILVMSDGTKIFLPEYESEIKQVLGTNEIVVTLKNNKPCLIFHGEENVHNIWSKLKPVMKKYSRSQQLSDIIMTDLPIPRTATGKIKRWDLEKLLQNQS